MRRFSVTGLPPPLQPYPSRGLPLPIPRPVVWFLDSRESGTQRARRAFAGTHPDMSAPTRLGRRFFLFSATVRHGKLRSHQVSGASPALKIRLYSFLTKDIERTSLRLPLFTTFVHLRTNNSCRGSLLGFVVWCTVAMQRMLVAANAGSGDQLHERRGNNLCTLSVGSELPVAWQCLWRCSHRSVLRQAPSKRLLKDWSLEETALRCQ